MNAPKQLKENAESRGRSCHGLGQKRGDGRWLPRTLREAKHAKRWGTREFKFCPQRSVVSISNLSRPDINHKLKIEEERSLSMTGERV
jgi:hypothetical protein